jgi:hypothetical protein
MTGCGLIKITEKDESPLLSFLLLVDRRSDRTVDGGIAHERREKSIFGLDKSCPSILSLFVPTNNER